MVDTDLKAHLTQRNAGSPPPLAGLKPEDHYKSRLPKWRYALRELLLPIIRWETPYLAIIQQHVRTPFFDSYFAITANLGTHTFFMVFLPLLFWFGLNTLGRAMVHCLLIGGFMTGFVKDMFCLPRPLSPPLHRITMSGSAALEYGFPSTHSANAISVVVYILCALNANQDMGPIPRLVIQISAVLYAVTILFGRIYCGMHGFSDVIFGSAMGAALAVVQWVYEDVIDAWVYGGHWSVPWIIILTVLFLIRIHPEPADNCPCFDDGVACIAVVMGINVGHWHYAQTSWSSQLPVPGTVPFAFEELGWLKCIARILLGVVIIFAWREVAKPTLHKLLPPIFRIVDKSGLAHNRRHFVKATEYKKVPDLPEDSIREFPQLVRNIRRTRSDSVGPQSEADAYETIAYREKQRRDSISKGTVPKLAESPFEDEKHSHGLGDDCGPTDERTVFEMIERPRVRYDVEVVTKIVVYFGIAFFAVEGNPLIFNLVGLGSTPVYQ